MTQRQSETASSAAREEAGEAGFTLVELLVVLAILALIGTLVGPRVLGYVGGAKADTAATQLRNIANAAELYYLDVGAYPAPDRGLSALVESDGSRGWSGPYLKSRAGLDDPWGRPYAYESFGQSFRIVSLGRDGAVGGEGEDRDLSSDAQ